jgi:threonine/homoserine/homoserine lactone efflux protein
MLDRIQWGTFFTATITLLLIPGPSVMYVVPPTGVPGQRPA